RARDAGQILVPCQLNRFAGAHKVSPSSGAEATPVPFPDVDAAMILGHASREEWFELAPFVQSKAAGHLCEAKPASAISSTRPRTIGTWLLRCACNFALAIVLNAG